jgi:hypothetical protein
MPYRKGIYLRLTIMTKATKIKTMQTRKTMYSCGAGRVAAATVGVGAGRSEDGVGTCTKRGAGVGSEVRVGAAVAVAWRVGVGTRVLVGEAVGVRLGSGVTVADGAALEGAVWVGWACAGVGVAVAVAVGIGVSVAVGWTTWIATV